MAWYVVLANFTDQGIRAVKETPKRAQAFRETAGALGVKIKDIYWTLGHHDVVLTMEAPDDETAAAPMLKVGALGNLTSQTLRAFTEAEIAAIASRV